MSARWDREPPERPSLERLEAAEEYRRLVEERRAARGEEEEGEEDPDPGLCPENHPEHPSVLCRRPDGHFGDHMSSGGFRWRQQREL